MEVLWRNQEDISFREAAFLVIYWPLCLARSRRSFGPGVLEMEDRLQARDYTEEKCLLRNVLNKEHKIVKSTTCF